MDSTAEFPTNPPVKRVAAGIIAAVLLTMGTLVWFNTKDLPEEVGVTQQPGHAPLLNFSVLDKTDYQEKGDDLQVNFPGELSALDGKKVSIAGFMAPYEALDDMRTFLLMPTSGGCFFCQAPSLSQVIMVQQTSTPDAPGKLPYIQEPILVTATLHLYSKASTNPGHKDGFIFDLDDAQISKLSDNAAEAAGLTGAAPLVRR